MVEREPTTRKEEPAIDGALVGRPVVAGEASGPLVFTDEPLSFWGGYDPETGEITDRSHPLSGSVAAGAVLALPETRGSSTTTAVLLEAIRKGTAPAAFVTRGVDSFLALAAVVAEEMYGSAPPVVALDPAAFDRLGERMAGALTTGTVRIEEDGRVVLLESTSPPAGSDESGRTNTTADGF